MSENEEEEEIKIEYFESLEVDPLCENSGKPSENNCTDDSILSNFPDENINQYASNNVNGSLENHVSGLNDENYDPVVSENKETWYKLVDSSGKYVCKFCENSYSTIQTVRHHTKNKHLDEYKHIKIYAVQNIRRCKLKCHICKKRFKNMNNLQEHIQNHGIDNIQKSCFICHATFHENTEMLAHISNKHPSIRKKLHVCLLCGYSTSKRSHFRQHENTHSRINQKKCSYCEYTTNHQPNLTIHERIHTNDKLYLCSFNGCDYRCTAKSGMYSHRLKHEKKKNLIYCDKCSYSTVYKQSLKKHMDSHERHFKERERQHEFYGHSRTTEKEYEKTRIRADRS